MALSTNKPKAKIKANSTIIFIDCPVIFNHKIPVNIEIGIAKPTKSAFLKPKKKSKIKTTNSTPIIILFSKLANSSRVYTEASLKVEIVNSSGNSFCIFSTTKLILSAVNNTFCPDRLITSKEITGFPSALA